ncbi:MAG: tetraacyldisaccharide 4'-kinase [Thermoguttaceae bacterium]|nr:tetraacyldisaccharide 4'-kinase [Thermoguttaceae bacterium]
MSLKRNAQLFSEIISGKKRGFLPSIIRSFLRILESFYTIGVRINQWLFDHRLRKMESVSVPVISIGNLTTGGTGKTPLVAWLARWLTQQAEHPAILSRGYGAPRPGIPNDEAVELEWRFRTLAILIPHFQQPDRVASARRAVAEKHASCLVLDDGFQHRRLARDLNIVLLDATEPFGFDHLLPRGLLREPVENLNRADWVILSRANAVKEQRRAEIYRQIHSIVPEDHWAEIAFCPSAYQNISGQTLPIDAFHGQKAAAFCGIGNPSAFFHGTLVSCGVHLLGTQTYPDHYRYTSDDIDTLNQWVHSFQYRPAVILCTMKDLVKLEGISHLDHIPLYAVVIDIQWLKGKSRLIKQLQSLIMVPISVENAVD